MAKKSIDIIISTALKATGITAARQALSSLASHASKFGKTVGKNLMNIKAGFDMITGAARKFAALLSNGMAFEKMTSQFKVMTGDMDTAKSHMKDLQDLCRTPPFSLEAFASASQAMLKMTDGVLGYRRELELVGDTASATGNDVSTVAQAVGMAYQVIRDGQPFGRAASQLVNLGIITKKQAEEFDDLSKAGEDNAALWTKFEDALLKYKGAMGETEKTAKGLVDAIQGEAQVAMTEFSSALTEQAKPALTGLLERIRELNDDGSIERWASTCVSAMSNVASATSKAVGWLTNAFKASRNFLERVGSSVGGFVGTLYGGGSLSDAADAAKQSWRDQAREQEARVKDQAEREAKIREEMESRIAARKAKRAEESAKLERESRMRVIEDLSRAQQENDKRNAEKSAKEREKAEKQAAKERAAEDEKSLRALHDERLKMIAKEEQEAQKAIQALNARGAADPMSRGGGGGWQGSELRARRQSAINESRFARARNALQARIDKAGVIDITNEDDIKKLGRLSNLDRATLERMQLDKQNEKLKDLEKQRADHEKQMAENLKDIKDRLKNLGL